MRIEFATQPQAQAFADAVHARMISANPSYARSVAAGQTTAWARPYQDLDMDGKPTGNWWVNIKTRVNEVLTSGERLNIKPYA